MSTINLVSRRGFLERFVSAGALIVGVPLRHFIPASIWASNPTVP
jgi:hypothetical protein